MAKASTSQENVMLAMSKDEIRQMLEEIVERKVREVFKELVAETGMPAIEHAARNLPVGAYRLSDLAQAQGDKRTLEEVFASIERHRWTPPPGSPSTLEMIREDRDNDELYR